MITEQELADKLQAYANAPPFSGDYRKVFDAFARNNQIGIDGLALLLEEAGVDGYWTRRFAARAIVGKVDTNKDGFITWDEFETFLAEHVVPNPLRRLVMPPIEPPPPANGDPWPNRIQYIFYGLILLLQAGIAAFAGVNHSKIQEVQTQVDQKSTQIVDKQEEAAAKTDAVKKTLEKEKEEKDRRSGTELYVQWAYLADLAAQGDDQAKVKAAEARKLYEEHLKKQKNPRP